MKAKLFVYFSLAMVVIFIAYLRWDSELDNTGFECKAKMHTRIAANICDGNSVFDLFLSMHNDGSGYYIVLGSYSCPNEPPKVVDTTVHFTYKQSGQYYSLNLDKRNADVAKMVKIFKYDEIKIKIKKLDDLEYIIYLPFEQPMICKQD
ncbi:Uncharacterised protein [Serratia quinivorans]|uniref:hypothetical protein n=1 Tax=Serratia quinivorans TaxID=137545 RepID=UPI00217B4963|nr:hypothetical protein [Serratia quinivorans]CAI1871795.1 Uncharacterised protein [Serratia quinivorans]CAI1902725.1 Uncharacterised protein [Serratia quinivorans]